MSDLTFNETPIRTAVFGANTGGWVAACLASKMNVICIWEDDETARRCLCGNFQDHLVEKPQEKIPHHDLAIIDDRKSWAHNAVLKIKPRVVCYAKHRDDSWLTGYKKYESILNPVEFNIKLTWPKKFVVAFREDIQPKFLSFPFPDPIHGKIPEGVRHKGMRFEDKKNAMGFPERMTFPVSTVKSMPLLEKDVCPPVAKAILQEILVWIF